MWQRVGFTGTRDGMTAEQILKVGQLLVDDPFTTYAHHGDCLGADADFHKIARTIGLELHGHPPLDPKKRAFCEFYSLEVVEEAKGYIERDHDIVDMVDWMIACPRGFEEELRSGTWATIRYARKTRKQGHIVWPDGKVSDINESYS
jgi:hypothetical protein